MISFLLGPQKSRANWQRVLSGDPSRAVVGGIALREKAVAPSIKLNRAHQARRLLPKSVEHCSAAIHFDLMHFSATGSKAQKKAKPTPSFDVAIGK